MERAFTRTQVEQHFMEGWASSYVKQENRDNLSIDDVSILEIGGTPIWVLEITIQYQRNTGRFQHYFYQKYYEDGFWLRTGSPYPLPKGCMSIQEEVIAQKESMHEASKRVEASLEVKRAQHV